MICINKPRVEKNGRETPRVPFCGLTSHEVEESRRRHGDNRLSEQKPIGFFRRFLSNLNDPVIRVLLVALGLHLLLMFRRADWMETIGIAASILLASVVSTVSQMGSEAAFAKLRAQESVTPARVFRDGAWCCISSEEIVVGDVVAVGAGEAIAADGCLIEGEVKLDQSAMTGESREVVKRAGGRDEETPSDEASLFRGCTVLGGQGRMLVRKVGDATMLGGISREVQQRTRESPLQLRLSKLARQISVLGYVAAVLIGLASLFYAFVIDSGFQTELIRMKLVDLSFLSEAFLNALTLALTVVVVAVPEGLPMMVAVVLSANIRRMLRDHVLVRKAAGIEAAGSMDLLFTDKTGTLTDGKLSVGRILLGDGRTFDTPDQFAREGGALFEAYAAYCKYGSEASAVTDKRGERQVVGGNATDRALLSSVLQRKTALGERIGHLPFDSARKYAAANVTSGGRRYGFVAGAPELLLPHLTRYRNGEGRESPLNANELRRRVSQYAEAGERVLLMAWADGEVELSRVERGEWGGLCLLCVLTLSDRLRPEAKTAVGQLQGAGVQVVMITGDAPETAARIAENCGIVNGRTDLVLTGRELAELSDHKVKELLPRLAVVARALPTDKSRLVRLAQEEDRVVGMTGDGINDAPALRRADIGFAMGSGAAVAKEAGDVVILDDNLASIVRAVLYGRTIFKSIRKFITLQLTMNFCAVGVCMIGPFIGVDAPVTVVQMLWINLIMDTLGGLAFAGEAPRPRDLCERPKRRTEPILCRYMVNEILFLGGYTVGLCLLFLKHPAITSRFRSTKDDLCLLTAFFALFIFASVFNCFNARTDRLRPLSGLSGNKTFVAIMVAVLAVQIAFVYLGGSVLRTMPLTARELGLTALLALSVFPAEKLRLLLWRALGRTTRY